MELPVSFREHEKLSPEEFNAYLTATVRSVFTAFASIQISSRQKNLKKYVHSRLKRYRGLIMVIIIVEKISRQRILIIMPVCIIAGAISNDTGTRTSY